MPVLLSAISLLQAANNFRLPVRQMPSRGLSMSLIHCLVYCGLCGSAGARGAAGAAQARCHCHGTARVSIRQGKERLASACACVCLPLRAHRCNGMLP